MNTTRSEKSSRRRFLAATGVGAVGLLAGCNAPGLATSSEESFDVSPEDATSVQVLNRTGNVTIRPGSGDTVSVTVVKRGFGIDESVLDRISVDRSVSDGVLTIAVVYPSDVSRVSTDLTVSLPDSLDLQLAETANGGVDVERVSGDATLRAGNGGVHAAGTPGFLTLEAGNGGIEARDVGGIDKVSAGNGGINIEIPAIRGDTEVSASNGGIDASISAGIDAMFEARVTNGGVDVSGLELTDATISPSRVIGTLGDGGPSLTLRAGNGGIDVQRLD
ncbi:hypothetical protein C499_17344 [Halogeometricum borinquense DSM 11551]|uniref:DUF4097 domain-containing protein n=2 Tax=Halogeometricum borinquense TaxID=60847 RepID=L9UH54_HALBP|nr:hypothetical protein [Halogeometricum borinquense]ELY23538.1 hypothetical protein C499_17344 [Halogeometricum borinquense DSM 11551]RYJ13272.1 hypothetical protein ELS19_04340 [Halogeometricum borinquense]